MPDVLVKGRDNEHPDPQIEEAGCWKRWDIIQVFNDGWKYGRMEKAPRFFKIIVPDSTVAELSQLLLGPILGNPIRINEGFDIKEHPAEILTRCRMCLKFNSLPKNIRGRLLKQGEIKLKFQTLKKYIYDKKEKRMLNEEVQ